MGMSQPGWDSLQLLNAPCIEFPQFLHVDSADMDTIEEGDMVLVQDNNVVTEVGFASALIQLCLHVLYCLVCSIAKAL